ncbi:MAG TPA: hypothetical protein VEF04_04735 [Blastocatellia bacterium]|nr:hypothetical protein [Blastocatellia bacterium]
MAKKTTAQLAPEPDYLANCINRILWAECSLSNQYKLHRAIAEAIRIAARDGELKAREYLIVLCGRAEGGEFADAKK